MARNAAKKPTKAAVVPPSGKGGREAALARVIDQIENQFGKGSIMRLGDDAHYESDAISTGALSLDLGLGVGGIPRGRVVEVYGPEASGKSTLALHLVANTQRMGGKAAYIDAEHALDPTYAARLGVNLDDLLVSQPDTGEQALEICELLSRSSAVSLVVVDSVAALVPKAEVDGKVGDQFVGLQARLMSQALRKLSSVAAKSRTTVVFINQIRMKIGVMFGNPETTPGGRALKFYASVRIDLRRIGGIKEGERDVGNVVRAKVVKNKVAPPFRKAEFDIMFGRGISWTGSVLDLAVTEKIAEKAGAWYSFGSTRLGQGRELAKRFLEENPDMLLDMENRVREKNGLPSRKAPAPVVAPVPETATEGAEA